MIKQNKVLQEDLKIEDTVRPKFFKDFIGQKETNKIKMFVDAAKNRNEVLDHFLFYGPPGLGKTTLANILANEMGKNIRITSGPTLSKVSDLSSLLTNISEGDFLFIDEIHRLNRNIEELLYSAMEDFALDIFLGTGPSARTVRVDLPKFTLIGATTRIGLLTNPLRDRFGAVHKLKFYSAEDLQKIIIRSANLLNVSIEEVAALELGKRSRGTPRIANRLLRRVRDISEISGAKKVNLKSVLDACEILGVDSKGLDAEDKRLLKVLAEDFEQKPVGLSTLSASLSEDKQTLEEVVEPYLIQLGLLKRTSQGRIITARGIEHLRESN
ncbi:Holliday junction branch migration DNA helicase RuvB [bacterium]|nr:Holliday junction branch migration DNA helicase RuvB [bacterium]